MELYTDSDYASDLKTRRSMSSGKVMRGGCDLYNHGRLQKTVALSSGEAEFNAEASILIEGL